MEANAKNYGEKSLGSLVKELAEDLSTLVRSEVALAKLEIRQTSANIGLVGAFFTAALFCVLFALAFLLVTAVLALATVIAPWLSALVVAVTLLIGAGILGFLGKRKLEKIEFVPKASVESVKADIQLIRAELSGPKGTDALVLTPTTSKSTSNARSSGRAMASARESTRSTAVSAARWT